jgi:hypothetical protein
MRRLVASALLAGGVGMVLLGGASARSHALQLVRVAHFNAPVYATVAPGEPGNLYVVEQAGVIRVWTGSSASPCAGGAPAALGCRVRRT